MALQAEQIDDLLNSTRSHLDRLSWIDMTTDLQDYPGMYQILDEKKVSFDSGPMIEHTVMLDHSKQAKHTGLYGVDDTHVGNVLGRAQLPWRHSKTSYAIDRREIAMNRNPSKIVDLLTIRRADAMIALTELIEQTLWAPAVNDEDTPFGFQYHIVWNANTGFTGGNNSQFPNGPSNINRSTNHRAKNWASGFSTFSREDVLWKMGQAMRECRFKPPTPDLQLLNWGSRPRYEIMVNGSCIQRFENMVEDRNDNARGDLARWAGRAMFRRAPFTWVPYLDRYSTSNPIVGIDWSKIRPVFLEGEYLNESPIKNAAPLQHTVHKGWVDLTWNLDALGWRNLWICAMADWANGI